MDLDAFDFFLLVFVFKNIAQEFNTQITEVTFAIRNRSHPRPGEPEDRGEFGCNLI